MIEINRNSDEEPQRDKTGGTN